MYIKHKDGCIVSLLLYACFKADGWHNQSRKFRNFSLPLFLLEKDIDRICNGIYTFVNLMKVASISSFALNCYSNRDRKYPSLVFINEKL